MSARSAMSMRTTTRALRTLLLAASVSVATVAAADAQERILVRGEPGTPVVAAELLVAVGPADEGEGQEGIAYLTARTVVAPILPALDSLGARLAIAGEKDAVSFTLTSAPDAWEEASRLLLVALFRDPVDSTATVRQRTALVRELEAREVSPADALSRQVDAAVFGEGHPWGRPAVGTAESVGKIGWADVDAFLRQNFTQDRAVMAVVGPVERDEVVDHLRSFLEAGPLRAPEVPPAAPAEEPVRREYDAITAWVSASWHFRGEADVEALRMLAHLALDAISFGPSRRSVYNARSELVRYAGGGEVRLHLVVPPREADQWAGRLRAAVEAYRGEPLAEGVFNERLRRYRGERLLALDSPEARARTLARLALLGGDTRWMVDLEGLTPERLHQAARALDEPVLVFLGPFERDSGGS